MIVRDFDLVGHLDPSVAHQDDVAARAADFHRDHVARAAMRRREKIERADAGRRTGQHKRDRACSNLVDGEHSAVALHQEQAGSRVRPP